MHLLFTATHWTKNNYPATHGGGKERWNHLSILLRLWQRQNRNPVQIKSKKWAHKLCTLLPLLTKAARGSHWKVFKLRSEVIRFTLQKDCVEVGHRGCIYKQKEKAAMSIVRQVRTVTAWTVAVRTKETDSRVFQERKLSVLSD